MKLKKAKRKLQKFIECYPETINPIEIRRDLKRNDGVKFQSNFEKF